MRKRLSTGGNAFATELEHLMDVHGMTQTQLARTLDVWDSVVLRWRRGGGISLHNVRRLADLFGVDRLSLELLAGYATRDPVVDQDDLDRQLWGHWFALLMQRTVPPERHQAFAKAVEALADIFADIEVPRAGGGGGHPPSLAPPLMAHIGLWASGYGG